MKISYIRNTRHIYATYLLINDVGLFVCVMVLSCEIFEVLWNLILYWRERLLSDRNA
jgi:hypothetical protein